MTIHKAFDNRRRRIVKLDDNPNKTKDFLWSRQLNQHVHCTSNTRPLHSSYKPMLRARVGAVPAPLPPIQALLGQKRRTPNKPLPPTILTPQSNFSSRNLPFPGTQPTDIDLRDPRIGLQIGQRVQVRRFDIATRDWRPIQHGTIICSVPIRGYLGTRAKGVTAQIRSLDSGEIIKANYSLFLSEVAPLNTPFLPITRQECWERRKRFDWIYALLPVVPGGVAKNNGGLGISKIWTPVCVVKALEAEQSFKVFVLAGSLARRYLDVSVVHPFNPETAQALRRRGEYIMTETGQIVGPK